MKLLKLSLFVAVLSLGLVQCTSLDAPNSREKKVEAEEGKTQTEGTTNDQVVPQGRLTGDAIVNALKAYRIPNGMLKGDESVGKKTLDSKELPGAKQPELRKGGVLTDPNIGGEPGTGYEGDRELPGVKLYRNKRYYEKATYSEPQVVATFMESIYPGMLLKSDQITNGAFATVREYTTNPITISGTWLAAPGSDASVLKSKVLQNPSVSEYRDALMDIFQGYPEESAVSTTLDMQELDLSHEGGLSASYEMKTLMDLGFKFDLNAGKYKSHLLVRFVQKLFTVSMDVPKHGLLENINTEDLNGYKPVYVSDIQYGRICYAVFSSNSLAVDLKASVEAMQKMIFGMSQGGSGSANYSHVLDQSQVQYVIIGGSQNDHTAAMNSGSALKTILSQPINIRNAAPIAFNLRFADDNSRARVMKATEMPLQEAIFIPNSQGTLSFGAQIAEIKATYAAFKKANVVGEVNITLPTAVGTKTMKLLNNTKKNPVIIEPDGHFYNVRDMTSKETAHVLLTDFLNKDKPGYYDQPVEIRVKLYFAGMNGNIQGKELAETTIRKPLRDFIFDCQDGSLKVRAVGLGAGIKYECIVNIELDPVADPNYK